MTQVDTNSEGYQLVLRYACLAGLDVDLALEQLMVMADKLNEGNK